MAMIVAEGLLANKNEEKKKEIKRTVDGEKVLTKETMSNTITRKLVSPLGRYRAKRQTQREEQKEGFITCSK